MSGAAIFNVKGRVALITGAASGLGAAMAEALAENGCRLGLLDVDADGLKKMADHLGPSVQCYAADVRDRKAVDAAVSDLVARYGRLDIAVANAGISDPDRAPLHETSDEGWSQTLDINLNGTMQTVRAALGPMLKQGSGKIVTVASMWGHIGPAGIYPRPAYAASKGAIVNFTREVALEYARKGIQVNALCPGFFRTPTRPRDEQTAALMAEYTPMGRIAAPDEIKGALLFLVSSASDFVTGTSLVIDGGVLAG